MENIQLDSGVRSFKIQDGGVLRFNPSDPNVYERFLEAGDKIKALEDNLLEQAKTAESCSDGSAVVRLMVQADSQIKAVLNWVFGGQNDFDKILGGVNLLAVAGNGQQVVANLLEALEPILVSGARRYAQEKTSEAVRKANDRRSGV